MNQRSLGRLESIELRNQWPDEAQDFTPWLASQEGLDLLGETIDIELELVGQEKKVGPFRADILARYAGEDDDRYVAIENQYGRTNHDHFGKVITYGAGLQAATIVWIAESFTEEHRQALDWLNENAGERLAFFGLEIKLWQIGDSPPAPQFKIVSSPNEWAKAIKIDETREPSDTKLNQLHFWQELREYGVAQKSKLAFRKPRPQHWYTIALGRSGFHIGLTVNSLQQRIGCEIFMRSRDGKLPFDLLQAQKHEIEKELGLPLDWQRLDNKKGSRIVIYKSEVDLDDPQQREQAKQWLYQMANKFHTVFSSRIIALELTGEDDSVGEEG